MTSFYDEIEIEDMDYDPELETYFFPCPCGDKFYITKEQLKDGEEVGICDSCSLIIRIIYDYEEFMEDYEDFESEEQQEPISI